MKIPFTNIEFNLVNKDVKTPEQADIYNKFVPLKTAIYRINTDMAKYKNSVLSAENVLNPTRYSLYQVYQSVMLDAHLSACIEQRKNLILSKRFKVVGLDGEENIAKSDLINKKWFYEFNNYALDSMYWGHSLVQFKDIVKDEFECVELIPRQFVRPEFHIVVKNYADMTGNDYLKEPFKEWCIGVGMPQDLGLLLKAAPLVIWKKNALGSWAEFQNIFGVPARIGKTNLKDPATFQNMVDMLANWGLSQYGVFGKDDIVELIESSNSDAYEVFDKMIERVNSELSKLILGQTSTIAEKSFVGSAEVHERVLDNYAEKDEQFIESVHNYQLVPMLRNFGILGEGDRIECDDSEELSQIEHNKLVIELLKTGKYTIPADYIQEELGIPVEVSEQNTVAQVKNELSKYYP
jgi:hypothetical protein